MTACCFVHIYTTSPAVSIWFCIFSLKKIRQIKTIWLLWQKSICQLQVFLKKKKKKIEAYTYREKEIRFLHIVANQIRFEGKINLIPLPPTVAAKLNHKLVLTLNNITETVLQSVLIRNLHPDPVGFRRNCCSIKTELSFGKQFSRVKFSGVCWL